MMEIDLKKLTLIAAISSLLLPLAAYAEELSVDTVVHMASAGLGDEAIIAKINSEGKVFELSTDQMISLKQKGVSSAVIAALMGGGKQKPVEMSLTSPDPKVPHPSGFYLLMGAGAEARMQRIDPTITSQAKTGGVFGYALTGGLASMSVKVAVANEAAKYQAQSGSPKFYMFLDESNNIASNSSWASGANASISSPSELTLVRLDRKKGRREARVGSMNIAGAKSGVMDKDRLTFTHEMVRPGVYQIEVSPSLAPGEYGFLYSFAGTGTNGAMTARIFDFSIR